MYKPILPSSLVKERSESDLHFSEKINKNTCLRLGTIVRIIETDDDDNLSKLTTEYDVMAVENKNTTLYKNVVVIDSFGGIADYTFSKKRSPKDSKKVIQSGSLKKQTGSLVLLLCIDGNSSQGVIIGGLAHPDRKIGKINKSKGQHLEGEFNGINWQIDKDGALTIKFKSASTDDGIYKDESAGGTTIKIEKDGSIELSDGNTEKIRLDKAGKSITIEAAKDISVKTNANLNVDTTQAVNVKATTDLLAEATMSLTVKSGAALNMKATGPFEIDGANVNIKSQAMVQLKAMQVMIDGQIIFVGKNGATPAVTLNTIAIGIGNLGGPVISNFIGPFSSSVFIGS